MALRSDRHETPPGGEIEEFRDVEAIDRDHALVLALNNQATGEPVRIYRTADGGATWRQVFRAADPEAFFSCMAFFDHRRGLAVGDAIGTKFPCWKRLTAVAVGTRRRRAGCPTPRLARAPWRRARVWSLGADMTPGSGRPA
ncbi:hypothetical protein ACRJ4B_32810 [Streptomyces sp. GTA36]|uniref:hypothetical protein n=1 Tax=Streptomyces sp. 2-1 TaxID=412710 RepID=UPI003AFA8B0D